MWRRSCEVSGRLAAASSEPEQYGRIYQLEVWRYETVETDSSGGRDIKEIEAALGKLWERARRVSEMVVELRKENQQLRESLAEHEQSGRSLAEAVRRKEGELANVQSELRKLQQNGSSFLNKDEKEVLAEKIKELISKIESRL